VLAEPVRTRLAAYLDHRNRRWPNTANPHLFIHYKTAGRTDPVGARWVRLTIGPGLTPTAIREDRILNEAHATGGDNRRLADLFGLSIQATPASPRPTASERPSPRPVDLARTSDRVDPAPRVSLGPDGSLPGMTDRLPRPGQPGMLPP
jgi:hypothetical protein